MKLHVIHKMFLLSFGIVQFNWSLQEASLAKDIIQVLMWFYFCSLDNPMKMTRSDSLDSMGSTSSMYYNVTEGTAIEYFFASDARWVWFPFLL
jgi:hypothetical protein